MPSPQARRMRRIRQFPETIRFFEVTDTSSLALRVSIRRSHRSPIVRGSRPFVRGLPLIREGVPRTPHQWKSSGFLPFVRGIRHS